MHTPVNTNHIYTSDTAVELVGTGAYSLALYYGQEHQTLCSDLPRFARQATPLPPRRSLHSTQLWQSRAHFLWRCGAGSFHASYPPHRAPALPLRRAPTSFRPAQRPLHPLSNRWRVQGASCRPALKRGKDRAKQHVCVSGCRSLMQRTPQV